MPLLIQTDRQAYSKYIKDHYIPVYMEPWYLDIVCGGEYGWVPHLLLKDDHARAVWICHHGRKLGLQFSLTPQLSPYTGLHAFGSPLSKQEVAEYTTFLQRRYAYMEQDIHFQESQWSDMPQKVTYIITADIDEETAYSRMKSDYRRKIKNCHKSLLVMDLEFSHFREILSESFAKKDQPLPYPMDLFEQLDAASAKHKRRTILAAQDEQDNIVAAAYFLHDKKYTYYLGGGQIAGKNAMYLLLWTGIRDSLRAGRSFDFEGSMIPGVAQFFRGFGGDKRSYTSYHHYASTGVKWLVALRKRLSS